MAHQLACILLLLVTTQRWTALPDQPRFHIATLPAEGLLLDKGWKYQAGDNPGWAQPGYDDRDWQPIDPTRDIHDLPALWQTEVSWLRLRFTLDSALRRQSLALLVSQTAASEIYLNGRLIGQYGQIGRGLNRVEAAYPPFGEFISLQPGAESQQVLAVRFALQKDVPYVNFAEWGVPAQALWVVDMPAVSRLLRGNIGFFLDYLKVGIFFILALLHLVLLLYAPTRKANRYFFVFALLSTVNFSISSYLSQYVHLAATRMYLLMVIFVLCTGSYFFFLLAAYAIFQQGRGVIFHCLTGVFLLSLPLFLLVYRGGWLCGVILFPVLVFSESARIGLLADQRKNPGIQLVRYGAIACLLLYPLSMAFFFGPLPAGPNGFLGHLFFTLAITSLPVSLSIYLATQASLTSRSLEAKRVEVRQLSETTLRQEQEKRQLREMDEVKSRFFANLSHEFRTPLALIRGTVERLRRKDEVAAERQSGYGAIDRSVGKLLAMINQLLDLSRLEAGQLSLHPKPTNVGELLKWVGSSFASLFESKGITYRYTAPLHPVWVQLDGEKLEQIINNLLSNAAKFTPVGGEVSFTAALQPAEDRTWSLRIQVQDTGIGIPAAQLPRIFDRFHQVDNSATRSFEGAGIGLALVRELVELHGGEVKAESTEGRGSTFSVSLPLAGADEPDGVPSREKVHPASLPTLPTAEEIFQPDPPSTHRPHRASVLVVEDNGELRRFLARYLSETYQVREAENGSEGYRIALETVPDLVISDVMMPGMDGVSLCRMLKQDARTSHVPVVLLTAKADAESRLDGLETGADDYLTKPFSTEELRLRVGNLIGQRRKLREKYSQSLTLQPSEVTVTSLDEHFLRKVLAVTEENLANADFNVDAFGKAVGMSRAQLNRKLSALLDESPSEFIRGFRLKRAAALLQNGAGNVSEVAYQVGFANLPHFSKAFRDYHGLTPSQYLSRSNVPDEGPNP